MCARNCQQILKLAAYLIITMLTFATGITENMYS